MNSMITSANIRGTQVFLYTYNRSLELCARMNYETEVLDFIDTLNAEDVLYDLGAAEGRFALYAASKGIRVIAFEPENKNYDVFLENIKLNPAVEANLSTNNLAVGEKNQIATIKIGQPWAGGQVVSVGPGRVDLNYTFCDEQSIDVVSLDSFIAMNHLPLPTALKIDIDGSELPFLKGAEKTLANAQVKKIIFELCVVDANYSQIIVFLRSLGFREQDKFSVPNEPNLFNFIFVK